MLYATLTDLVAQFGQREVIALTDRNQYGEPDGVVAEAALQRASDTIDAYLSARYPLPMNAVPTQLVDICCDIARYKLLGAEVTETEPARLRYKDALKTLELIRDGKIDIGLTVAGQAPAVVGSIKVVGGARVFDRNSLSDY
jgi:phage gp36-like protein